MKRFLKQKPDVKFAQQILTALKDEETEMLLDATNCQNVDIYSVANQSLIDPLTKRELEILLSLTKNSSNPEIAEKLFISPQTVKRHLTNIYRKLDVENRQQAITKTKSLGII